MAIETDHTIRSTHDNMQFMAHHQDSAAQLITNGLHLSIEVGRTTLIKSLCRLIEHQHLRLVQQCPGQQHSLQLTTGQIDQLPFQQMTHLHLVQHIGQSLLADPPGQIEESTNTHGQGTLHMQSLWYVTDTQSRHLDDLST